MTRNLSILTPQGCICHWSFFFSFFSFFIHVCIPDVRTSRLSEPSFLRGRSAARWSRLGLWCLPPCWRGVRGLRADTDTHHGGGEPGSSESLILDSWGTLWGRHTPTVAARYSHHTPSLCVPLLPVNVRRIGFMVWFKKNKIKNVLGIVFSRWICFRWVFLVFFLLRLENTVYCLILKNIRLCLVFWCLCCTWWYCGPFSSSVSTGYRWRIYLFNKLSFIIGLIVAFGNLDRLCLQLRGL